MLFAATLLAGLALASAQCTITGNTADPSCACYMVPCATVEAFTTDVSVTMQNPAIVVNGKTKDSVDIFLGVPIAASTAGPNRFMPPQPYVGTDPVDAFKEHPCPQWFYPIGGTEDCLTVDIYKPASGTSMPVALWIHGGGFTSQNPYFNALPSMPTPGMGYQEGGASVTMIIHYRLGALGWMAHPGFADPASKPTWGAYGTTGLAFPDGYTGSGNYGMMDTLNAAAFAIANAAAFGIDPAKVSLFGESAGAAHVMALMASPVSTTIGVTNYIAQSPFISFSGASFSLKAREEMGALFSMRTGCATAISPLASGATALTEAACLRAANIELLIVDVGFGGPSAYGLPGSTTAVEAFDKHYGATAASLFLYNSIHVWPCVDGFILVKDPIGAYSDGTNPAINLIVGHNGDEYTTFEYNLMGGGPPLTVFEGDMAPDRVNDAWILALSNLGMTAGYQEIFDAVQAMVAGGETDPTNPMYKLHAGLYYGDVAEFTSPLVKADVTAVQMHTDAWFANGIAEATDALVSSGSRTAGTYRYVYGEDTDHVWAPVMGACHGCELTFILGFYKMEMTYLTSMGLTQTPIVFTPAMVDLGNTMQKYWLSFFSTGNPNTDVTGLPDWKPITSTDSNTMVFQSTFPTGASIDPCVQLLGCRIEPTKDFRAIRKGFFSKFPPTVDAEPPTCGSLKMTGGFSNLQMGKSTTCPPQPPHSCPHCVNTYGGERITAFVSSETLVNDGACCETANNDNDICGYEVDGPTCVFYMGTACKTMPGTGPSSTHLKTEDTCAAWCNAFTCGMGACSGCKTCHDLTQGTYCASWCNAYTCGASYCSGCFLCSHSAPKCLPFCNAYTCGFDVCEGCGTCKKVAAGGYCASWCNPYTSAISVCKGCPA
jgi:carboxylesterase type B